MSRISRSVIAIATVATALGGAVYMAEAQGSAKAKSSPSATPNLAANPAKKKAGGEDSRGLYQINLDPKQKGPGDKRRTFQGGGLSIND